MRNCLIPT
ncbi:hypothetical protein LINPERHAP1_LOCUS4612 [Linum perenne]